MIYYQKALGSAHLRRTRFWTVWPLHGQVSHGNQVINRPLKAKVRATPKGSLVNAPARASQMWGVFALSSRPLREQVGKILPLNSGRTL